MIDIKPIESEQEYIEACRILYQAQKAESETTGVLFNTLGLKPADLREKVIRDQGMCICAYVDGIMAGTLSMFPDHKERWYSKGYTCKRLRYLGVSPEYQRKNIGTALIDYMKQLEDYDIIHFSTGEMNKGAIYLYEKTGFILVDVRRGPVHNAYIMAYWKNGCPISQSKIKRHVLMARFKCLIKKLLPFYG